jgi:hypothetical protein
MPRRPPSPDYPNLDLQFPAGYGSLAIVSTVGSDRYLGSMDAIRSMYVDAVLRSS